ncbi:TRAP transporter small permease subunit [Paracoccus liaowanqingii]|uniref:TRAP transporter small permease protein n=1 Tax=Paracoccus liaowanqingii TaxID=2560053 RepID=A0A4P7HKJ5_9RHOB|nr:TRAP transporter small permease subunit [Paracoccus liaowanqingii]QBX34635.1 TRAP transporter small permease subunit [Paracoccus liaowanqingii]TGN40974.1 TRAP transporter small permease subunit [Paracoccus liaowanqingii]
MGALLALSRGIDRITTLIGRSVSWLILLAVLISATNAIIRKVFSISSNAWLEAQWYLFGAAFMLASAWTLLDNEHIRIDVIYGRWSRRAQHWIDVIGTVLFLLPFTTVMLWLTWPALMGSLRTGEVSMNAGGLALWPVRGVMVAGFGLLFAQGISELIKKVAVMRGIIPDPIAHGDTHEAALREAALMVVGLEDEQKAASQAADTPERRP